MKIGPTTTGPPFRRGFVGVGTAQPTDLLQNNILNRHFIAPKAPFMPEKRSLGFREVLAIAWNIHYDVKMTRRDR